MKDEYITKIIQLLRKCDDIEMLQIIYHLLQKQKAAKSLQKCV